MKELLFDGFEIVQPICKRCHHSKCPHCSDWCDIIATTEEQIKEFGIVSNEKIKENKVVLCCEGECVY